MIDVTITRTTQHKVKHEGALSVKVSGQFYVVEFPHKKYRYPICNVFEIEEDSSHYNNKQKLRESVPEIINI